MLLISVVSFSFYILGFSAKSIPGDTLNVTFSYCTADIVASITGGVFYMKFGAKVSYTGFFLLSIIGGILLVIFKDNENALIGIAFVAKFGVSAAFVTVYICSVKLLPSIYATSAFGINNTVARTLTMLSPLFAEQEYPIPIYLDLGALIVGLLAALAIQEKLPKAV